MIFAQSGLQFYLYEPLCVAFLISLVCSTCGISGAFLLLPYQMTFLGYTAPGVSATNQIFNILACPAGVWRFAREGRLLVPLAVLIAVGTLPGVFFGALIRLEFLANPDNFYCFAACVLLYLGLRLLLMNARNKDSRKISPAARCKIIYWHKYGFEFEYNDNLYKVSSFSLILVSMVVGLIGGIYGVGGGAILAPVLVSVFGLPIHALAGATLFATFLTSISGVAFYSCLAFFMNLPQANPDWLLGCILGCGGIAGMYCGATVQKYLPARILRLFLCLVLFALGINYLYQFMQSLY